MKKFKVIGMPMKYGCMVDGADMAYDSLKDVLESSLNVRCKTVVNTNYENAKEHLNDKRMKYVEPVMDISKRLYIEVYNSLHDNFPVIVGGDHSTCIGSISAVLDYYKGDVSVIYIDKHADIHTEKTSPSGNMHGIPLSICIGRCDDRFKIGNYKLNSENLYYIGLSNFEIEEIEYINSSNITAFMDFVVEEKKAEWIVKEIIKKIKTKYVHISFDLDSIKDEDFHAVNVAVEGTYQDMGGLDFKMAKKILGLLIENLNVISMDIVEYNPLLDNDLKCKKKVEELLLEIKDKRNDSSK